MAIVFTVTFLVAPMATEIVRGVFHAKRQRANGIGGTQDVALWGSFAMVGSGILAVFCWGIWFWSE